MIELACIIGGIGSGMLIMGTAWFLHERQNAKPINSAPRQPIAQPRDKQGRFTSKRDAMTAQLRREVGVTQ